MGIIRKVTIYHHCALNNSCSGILLTQEKIHTSLQVYVLLLSWEQDEGNHPHSKHECIII